MIGGSGCRFVVPRFRFAVVGFEDDFSNELKLIVGCEGAGGWHG